MKAILILMLVVSTACASTAGSKKSGSLRSDDNIADDLDEGFDGEETSTPSGPTLMLSLGKNSYAKPRLSMQKDQRTDRYIDQQAASEQS